MSNRTFFTDISLLTRRDMLLGAGAVGITFALRDRSYAGVELGGSGLSASAFASPPSSAKPWVYWWWLDGNASTEGISKDLEEMQRQGIAGVLITDAGDGRPLAPKGPTFMSEGWRENFRHAVREAGRLGIEMSVNLGSGWDAGGPWVSDEDALKQLVWSETVIEGSTQVDHVLARPTFTQHGFWPIFPVVKSDWYRDITVWAYRTDQREAWDVKEAVDVSAHVQHNHLHWKAPAGRWVVLRFGYAVSGDRIKDASAGSDGLEVDPLSSEAMDRHFAATAKKLIEDAGPLTGRTLKYMHIDSWELTQPRWTQSFVTEFRRRRGYDPLPFLAVLAKRTVGSAELSERFQWDYRRTLGDLVRDNYYGRLNALCKPFGLRTDSESGGPLFAQWIDALECQSVNDVPMAEFWATSWTAMDPPGLFQPPGVPAPLFATAEQVSPTRLIGSIRQAASATHIYGKPVCQGESFTNFNDDWIEDPYFLKLYSDRAFCLGVNRLCIHKYTLQTTDVGPGYQWEHVGLHLNRNVTWWNKSAAWLRYLARCSHMLQQGRFMADILYYSGEAIPNFVLTDKKPTTGFDFDEINADALLTRATAQDGHIVLPGGLKYRYLVIPDPAGEAMSPKVLAKLRELVDGGVTLIGSRAKRAPGLADHVRADQQVKALADDLWGPDATDSGMRSVGRGRVVWGTPLDQLIAKDGVAPDVELRGLPPELAFDWIHRLAGDQEIYFLANGSDEVLTVEAVFRVSGKIPELWDAVSGLARDLSEFREEGARTIVPMRFEARQSFFVVFQKSSPANSATHGRNFPALQLVNTLEGPWEVNFDPAWGGPEKIIFPTLQDWILRPEHGIQHYSGTATYRKTFDVMHGNERPTHLDLGVVKNLAQVRLNGHDLGVVWTAPWRVEVKDLLRAKGNELEIEIVNLWPNRLIADGKLPREQRKTVTNVRTYEPTLPTDFNDFNCPVCEGRKKSGAPRKLLSSGLLGPVTLLKSGES